VRLIDNQFIEWDVWLRNTLPIEIVIDHDTVVLARILTNDTARVRVNQKDLVIECVSRGLGAIGAKRIFDAWSQVVAGSRPDRAFAALQLNSATNLSDFFRFENYELNAGGVFGVNTNGSNAI
jgi:hypothetical protein